MKHHTVEIFSADCPLCKKVTGIIQVITMPTNTLRCYIMSNNIKTKMKYYDIKAVTTTIISDDEKTRNENKPTETMFIKHPFSMKPMIYPLCH